MAPNNAFAWGRFENKVYLIMKLAWMENLYDQYQNISGHYTTVSGIMI